MHFSADQMNSSYSMTTASPDGIEEVPNASFICWACDYGVINNVRSRAPFAFIIDSEWWRG